MNNILQLFYAFTLTFSPVESDRYCDSDFNGKTYHEYVIYNAITTNFDVEVTTIQEYFFVGGSSKNICKYFKGKSFLPIENEYTIRIGSRFNIFEIGYEHSCTHPIGVLRKDDILLSNHYGAYDRFFVKISNH